MTASVPKTMPLVAIVTPVYNGAKYLQATIDCVQAQTYPNIIHYILDNASSDATPQLIAGALGGNVRIVTARNPSLLQMDDNWNAGLDMVAPEAAYLKILCADDLIRADAIAKMVAVAESDPEINFVTAADVYEGSVRYTGYDEPVNIVEAAGYLRRVLSEDVAHIQFAHMFYRLTPTTRPARFVKERLSADADFVCRLLLEGKAAIINETLLYTRESDVTVTSSLGGQRIFVASGFDRAERYCPQVFTANGARAVIRRQERMLLRHLMAWHVQGGQKQIGICERILADHNVRPNLLDFADAVASWPVHTLLKSIRRWRRPNEYRWPLMTEAEFVAQVLGKTTPTAVGLPDMTPLALRAAVR